uniref:DUF1565 domain-containing protein n=1 Tax=Ascaris lumbricoides TaxID=6252 RepID=A0A0M3HSR5_ASCLU
MKCPSLAIAPSSDAQTLVKVGGQKVGEQCAAEETIEDAAARIVARIVITTSASTRTIHLSGTSSTTPASTHTDLETQPAVDYYTQYARANARSTVLLESGVFVRSVHGSGSPALESYDGRGANAPI